MAGLHEVVHMELLTKKTEMRQGTETEILAFAPVGPHADPIRGCLRPLGAALARRWVVLRVWHAWRVWWLLLPAALPTAPHRWLVAVGGGTLGTCCAAAVEESWHDYLTKFELTVSHRQAAAAAATNSTAGGIGNV